MSGVLHRQCFQPGTDLLSWVVAAADGSEGPVYCAHPGQQSSCASGFTCLAIGCGSTLLFAQQAAVSRPFLFFSLWFRYCCVCAHVVLHVACGVWRETCIGRCVSCVVCRVVCRVSCVVCRVSCVVCRVSCVVCRVSCVAWRVACGMPTAA